MTKYKDIDDPCRSIGVFIMKTTGLLSFYDYLHILWI
jgi:hypothetical protein